MTPPTGWSFPWSASDISWAVNTLTIDMADDSQAESTYPADAAYYAGWASHWQTALDQIHGLQYPQTAPPSASFLAPVLGWFSLAIELHRSDTINHPENASWNDQWIQNYQRLTDLWNRL